MQRALLVLLICASYLLFAGGPRWTAVPLLLLAGAAVLAAPRQTLAFPRAYRPLDASLAAVAFAIALQLVPLPRAVVSVVSPRTEAVRSAIELTTLDGPTSAWTSLSLDAMATADALGTVLLAILSFWVARSVFTGSRGTRRVCQALAAIGAIAALFAITLRVLSPRLVLGLQPTSTPSASPFGAFVNRNHFAGWLLMIALPVAGYLIAHLQVHSGYRRGWRSALREAFATGSALTAAAAGVCVGTIFLTLSRSALAGLGAAAVAAWLLVLPRVKRGRYGLPAVLAAAGTVIVVLVLFVDLDAWAARINSSFEPSGGAGGRAAIWRETLPIIGDFPVTGTGAGTFSQAMTLYQQSRIWVGSMRAWSHFNNAHSHFLQVAAEGGLLLALPVVGSLWFLIREGRRALAADRGEIYWIRAGAAAGLVGIGVQSVWEVSLVMPANAVMAATLAALVVHERSSRAPGGGETPITPGRR